MSEKHINPEVPNLPINYRQALREIEELCRVYPKLGKMLYMKLSIKYGVFNP